MERYYATTLRQLLTMTAGVNDGATADGTASFFLSKGDWVRNILTDPDNSPPGRGFAYSSAGAHLVSAVLTAATGQSVLAYARAHLFDPLGIPTRPAATPVAALRNVKVYNQAQFAWPTDPQGRQIGANLLKMTPRDMLKLGTLYVDQGRWHGAPVVPAGWVTDATTSHVGTEALSGGGGYGYFWWVTDVAGDPGFAAVGSDGQLIEVVPRRHLVVVISSESPTDPVSTRVDNGDLLELVATVIAPAASRR